MTSVWRIDFNEVSVDAMWPPTQHARNPYYQSKQRSAHTGAASKKRHRRRPCAGPANPQGRRRGQRGKVSGEGGVMGCWGGARKEERKIKEGGRQNGESDGVMRDGGERGREGWAMGGRSNETEKDEGRRGGVGAVRI